MSTFVLKLIAIITMLIDHIGAALIPSDTMPYMAMRIIGRIAFPIFIFLIVEGFHHTSDVRKYMMRLGIFALISEIPFDLAFFDQVLEGSHQNVFFTLFLGLLCIYLIDLAFKKYSNKDGKYIPKNVLIYNVLAGLITFVFCFLALLLKTDYSYAGILMMVAFYLFRGNKILISFSLFIVAFWLLGNVNALAVLALIPIWFYNGKKGKSVKYIFYIFYPAHLLILAAIKMFLL